MEITLNKERGIGFEVPGFSVIIHEWVETLRLLEINNRVVFLTREHRKSLSSDELESLENFEKALTGAALKIASGGIKCD